MVQNFRTTHVQQIRGSEDVEQQRARDQELALLREGQGHMGRAIGAMVRHMQSEGANVRQIRILNKELKDAVWLKLDHWHHVRGSLLTTLLLLSR